MKFSITSIGSVQSDGVSFRIDIDEPYRAGLLHLADFSHVIVFWWAHKADNPLDRAYLTEKLYYADNIEAGVFACRTPRRPNPIAMTVCALLDVDTETGTIHIPYIDAEPGTPVIDLKPYIGMSDRVKTLTPAPWFKEWPQWIPEKEGDMPDWVMQKLMSVPED
jgi:tRNA-Thr(GGU) m(6)t(6)A37 methyltransferase TsaA